MNLTISHIIPHPITSDDIRSYWNVLAQKTNTFHFAKNAIDAFEKADRVAAGKSVTLEVNFKDEKPFEIELVLSKIQKRGYIFSIIFKEEKRNRFLFRSDINQQFFPWVLETLHLGGKMFFAEIGFLSIEEKPNSSVQLQLDNFRFSIEEDPLIYWFSRMKIPDAFAAEINFVKRELPDKSYYLLPENIANRFLNKEE